MKAVMCELEELLAGLVSWLKSQQADFREACHAQDESKSWSVYEQRAKNNPSSPHGEGAFDGAHLLCHVLPTCPNVQHNSLHHDEAEGTPQPSNGAKKHSLQVRYSHESVQCIQPMYGCHCRHGRKRMRQAETQADKACKQGTATQADKALTLQSICAPNILSIGEKSAMRSIRTMKMEMNIRGRRQNATARAAP
jgi:hypothetical protein